jgi:hypothetical protein
MATFPSKVNYATGDILTATNMNDVGGAINLLDGAQYAGAKNRVLNSNFSVWQRGTTGAGSGTAFVADRWQAYRGTTGSTFSRQATNDTTNLPFIQYCIRAQRDSGNTSTTPYSIGQNFESVNSIPLAGKTVVLSFYARAGANYSAASGALEVNLATGTGTDQNIYTGLTGRANPILQNATLTTTWQRFTYSATLATTATQVAMSFAATPVGTASTNDYFEVTGVQLEAANSVSNYAPNGATYQAELAACQRYYYRQGGDALYQRYAQGQFTSTTAFQIYQQLPVTMRVTPTSIEYATLTTYNAVPGLIATTGAVVLTSDSSKNVASVGGAVTAGGVTGATVALLANNSLSSYLAFSAEL